MSAFAFRFSDESDDSISDSEDDTVMYECKLCPGSRFSTVKNMDEHRKVHKKERLEQEKKKQSKTQTTNLEIPLPNGGGKLSISISVEHVSPPPADPQQAILRNRPIAMPKPRRYITDWNAMKFAPYNTRARYIFPSVRVTPPAAQRQPNDLNRVENKTSPSGSSNMTASTVPRRQSTRTRKPVRK